MRILITRPGEDGTALAARLQSAGHDVIHAPVMDIIYADGPGLDLSLYDAVLVTSANGVRALARRTLRRDVAVLAVGQATASAAQALGFARVTASGGDVAALVDTVCQSVASGARLLHGAGSVTAGDLQGDLAARGYIVDRVVLYDARAVRELAPEAIHALQQGVDVALFYSPRTARLFVDLAHAAGLQDAVHPAIAAGLSRSVTDALQSLPWRRIVTAIEPTEAALLQAAKIVV